MEIIELDNTKYFLLEKVSVNTKLGYDEIKKKYNADIILKREDTLYVCSQIIDVEFNDIIKEKNS